jgi:hypothetical protein
MNRQRQETEDDEFFYAVRRRKAMDNRPFFTPWKPENVQKAVQSIVPQVGYSKWMEGDLI